MSELGGQYWFQWNEQYIAEYVPSRGETSPVYMPMNKVTVGVKEHIWDLRYGELGDQSIAKPVPE